MTAIQSTESIEIHPIKIGAKVKATDRYITFLKITSLFLVKPLTPMEMKIMDEFYHVNQGLIDTETRKTVRENLDISPEHLNNYIKALRKKKMIVDQPNSDTVTLNPHFLQPMPEGSAMVLILNLDVVL